METKVEVSVAGVEYMTEGMLEMGVHTGGQGLPHNPNHPQYQQSQNCGHQDL